MEQENQQYKDCLWTENSHVMAPNTDQGDVYLAIAQDLAQAVIIVESDYYDFFLDND